MTGIARLGDRTLGTCTAHRSPITVGGTIVTASGNTFVNNKPSARLGDKVLTDCGHTGLIVTASPNVDNNTRGGVARLGDMVGAGPYTAKIISASGDVIANT